MGNSGGLLTINNDGILDLNGHSVTVGGLSDNGVDGTGVIGTSSTSGSPVTLTISTATGTGYTFSGTLENSLGSGTDAVALVIAGSGTGNPLREPNTFTGGTKIEGGTLSIGGSLGSGTVEFSGGGGTFKSFDGGTISNTIQIDSDATATLDAAGQSTTFSGAISGSGTLETADSVGSGQISISGAAAPTGTITIGAVPVLVSDIEGLTAAASDIEFTTPESTLVFNVSGPVTATCPMDIDTGATATLEVGANAAVIEGVICGAGSLVIEGSTDAIDGGYIAQGERNAAHGYLGELQLSGANSYTGGTKIENGADVIASNSSAFGTGVLDVENSWVDLLGNNVTVTGLTDGGLTVNTGGIESFSGTGKLVVDPASGTTYSFAGAIVNFPTIPNHSEFQFWNGTGWVVYDNGSSGVWSPSGGGTVALEFDGPGTEILSGESTFSGGAKIDEGTVVLGAADGSITPAPLGSGSIEFVGNATMQFDFNGTLANNITIDSGETATFDTQGNSVILSGTVSGTSGNVVINDSLGGTLELLGGASYSGMTTISAGTLKISSAKSSGTEILFSGTMGVLQLIPAYPLNEAIVVGPGSTGTIDLQGQSVAVNGTVSGGGTLQVADSVGGGSLSLAYDVTTSGLTISGGATVSMPSTASSSTAITFANDGGYLNWTVGSLTNVAINAGAIAEFSGVSAVTNVTGYGWLVNGMTPSSYGYGGFYGGTVDDFFNFNGDGGIDLNGDGTLPYSSGSLFSGNIDLNTYSLTVNTGTSSGDLITFPGVIGGSGTFAINGDGTVAMGGTNNWTTASSILSIGGSATLQLLSPGALIGLGTISGGGTLDLNNQISSQTINFLNVISGFSALTTVLNFTPSTISCPCQLAAITPAPGSDGGGASSTSMTTGGITAAGYGQFGPSMSLTSDGFGSIFGTTLLWSNQPSSGNSFYGSGMSPAQMPYLMEEPGGDLVYSNGSVSRMFNSGTLEEMSYFGDKLTQTTGYYTLVDTAGDVLKFHDFSDSITGEQGQLSTYADAGGNLTTIVRSGSTGQISTISQPQTLGATTTTETLTYHYNGSNLVDKITLTSYDGSTTTTLAREEYTYYEAGDYGVTHGQGNSGDLELAVLETGDTTPIPVDTTYYRYYTSSDGGLGYKHGLEYMLTNDSYERLLASVGGTSLHDAELRSNTQIIPFAGVQLQYNSLQQITSLISQGTGCSVCSAGQGTYTYNVSVRWNTGLQGLVRWGRGVEMTPRRFQEPRDARTTNERAGQRSGEGTYWRQIMTRWQRSRQAICDFCSTEELSQASFYAWRRELRRRDDQRSSSPRATTTKPLHPGPPRRSAVLCVAGSGGNAHRVESGRCVPFGARAAPRIILRIPPGCDRLTLAMVLALLEQRPC